MNISLIQICSKDTCKARKFCISKSIRKLIKLYTYLFIHKNKLLMIYLKILPILLDILNESLNQFLNVFISVLDQL